MRTFTDVRKAIVHCIEKGSLTVLSTAIVHCFEKGSLTVLRLVTKVAVEILTPGFGTEHFGF